MEWDIKRAVREAKVLGSYAFGKNLWESIGSSLKATFHISREQFLALSETSPVDAQIARSEEDVFFLRADLRPAIMPEWDPQFFVAPFPEYEVALDDSPWVESGDGSVQYGSVRFLWDGHGLGIVNKIKMREPGNPRDFDAYNTVVVFPEDKTFLGPPMNKEIVDRIGFGQDEGGRLTQVALRTMADLACLGLSFSYMLNSSRVERVPCDDPLRPPNRQQRRAEGYVERPHFRTVLVPGRRVGGTVRSAMRGEAIVERPGRPVRSHKRHYASGLVITVTDHLRWGTPEEKALYRSSKFNAQYATQRLDPSKAGSDE